MLRFNKQGEKYVCGEFEIIKIYGYHLAFKQKFLLNKNSFSWDDAYQACVKELEDSGTNDKETP